MDIATQFAANSRNFLNTLQKASPEELNEIPYEGGWTLGQVGEHILKSSAGILQITQGPDTATTRDPEEKGKKLQELFLDMNNKLQAPDFIIPSATPKKKDELVADLYKTFKGLEEVGSTKDLQATCTGGEMPMNGTLTRKEWLMFADAHVQRHIHQLDKINGYLRHAQD